MSNIRNAEAQDPGLHNRTELVQSQTQSDWILSDQLEDLPVAEFLAEFSKHPVWVDRTIVPSLLNHLPQETIIRTKGRFCSIEIPSERRKAVEAPRKTISVVIPIYFEERIIDELVRRLSSTLASLAGYDYELIFVNDGSTDESLARLLEHKKVNRRLNIIDFSRNFGHQAAITAGMDHAQGDAVVVIDGDLQDPPEVILEMVRKWEEGFHVAYGVRKHRDGETRFKLLTAKIFYRLLGKFSDIEIPFDTGDFRLMDRSVVDQLKLLPERSRYIRGLVNWVGFKHAPVPYKRDSRYAGETKFTLHKMVRFAFDGITGFSDKPLYMAGYIGLLFSALSLAGIGWVFYGYIFNKSSLVTGWASLMTLLFFLGALQLLSLSIIGQYIARIYKEARGRPHYIVKKFY